MEEGRRNDVGLVQLRSGAQSASIYSTGNPGAWNPDQRPGDNKWSMCLFARNPDTGEAKWAYQMTPHDAWDYDGINESVLVDLDISGHDA